MSKKKSWDESLLTEEEIPKKRKKKKIPPIRQPRQKGFTNLLHQISQLTDPDKKQKQLTYVKELLIEQWTISNYLLNQDFYSIPKLSQYLNTTESHIQHIQQKTILAQADLWEEDEDEGYLNQLRQGNQLKSQLPNPQKTKETNQKQEQESNIKRNNKALESSNNNNSSLINHNINVEVSNKELGMGLGINQGTLIDSNQAYQQRQLKRKQDKMRQLARAGIFRALFLGSETRALAAHQTDILLRAQGHKYVPFLSGEVNKSIANLISATKGQVDMLKPLLDGNPNILINQFNQDNSSTNNYLTPNEAMNIVVSNSTSPLLNPAGLPVIEDIPIIDARRQDLRQIGIKYDGTQESLNSGVWGDKEKGTQGADGIEDLGPTELTSPYNEAKRKKAKDKGKKKDPKASKPKIRQRFIPREDMEDEAFMA